MCIGVFDGVHRGHQAVVRQAVTVARANDEPAVVCTFDRHPAMVLAPERVPPSIGSLGQNLAAISALGASSVVVLPFDSELARLSADEFLSDVLRGRLRAGRLVVGHDFAMGRGREGTVDWLRERIETTVVPAFEEGGHRVSSTSIRQAVAAGDVGLAGGLLGRPFALAGVVVGGQRLGRELGYPTANLARTAPQVLPGDGVYAGACDTPFGRFGAAVAVGVRPTVGVQGGGRTVEAYLIDYPGDSLYGRAVELAFFERLRGEEAFGSLEELKAQMALDVEAARRVVAARGVERATRLELATFSLGS